MPIVAEIAVHSSFDFNAKLRAQGVVRYSGNVDRMSDFKLRVSG